MISLLMAKLRGLTASFLEAKSFLVARKEETILSGKDFLSGMKRKDFP